MPLFVTLSGALFDRSKNQNSFSDYFWKKTKRLLIPYYSVLIGIYIPVRLLIGYYDGINLSNIIFQDILLGSDVNYLWYLVMLMEVSLIFWILRNKFRFIYENKKIELIIVFLILNILGMHCGNLPFQVHRTLEFLLWFEIGIIINKNLNRFCKANGFQIGIVLSVFVIAAFFTYILKNTSVLYLNSFFYYFTKLLLEMNRIVLAMSGVCVSWMVLAKSRTKLCQYLGALEEYSFDIYLYHVPVITLYSWFVQNKLFYLIYDSLSYLLFVILKFVVSIFGSILLILIINTVKRKVESYGES